MHDLQTELQKWLTSMRPTQPKDREQAVRHKHDDAGFLERLRHKIAEDARAERR